MSSRPCSGTSRSPRRFSSTSSPSSARCSASRSAPPCSSSKRTSVSTTPTASAPGTLSPRRSWWSTGRPPMKSLFLIDGHNVLYRTFYALPRLSAPDGTPTNAVLGTARILLKILREENPDAIAAVFDSREPTPRHALFPEYKANRLKVPEDLAAQIPVVEELIDALGVPRIEVPGVEADDVIGTLAAAAEV